MKVVNPVMPDMARAWSSSAAPRTGRSCMVNLLKFKPRAQYADGTDSHLSGAEAYMRYGEEVRKLVEGLGGRVRYSGAVTGLMIGEVEELWDAVALAEYPSLAAFREMAMSPAMHAIEHHRKAGLAGQLNIKTKPSAGF